MVLEDIYWQSWSLKITILYMLLEKWNEQWHHKFYHKQMAKLKANIITSRSDKNIGGQTEQSQIIVIAFKAAMCWHIFFLIIQQCVSYAHL